MERVAELERVPELAVDPELALEPELVAGYWRNAASSAVESSVSARWSALSLVRVI